MNDVINSTIASYAEKGQRVEAIKNYIEKRYNISIDQQAIRERLRSIRRKYKFV